MAKKLTNLEGVYVKQKLDVLEMITGFENENYYEVFAMENGQRKTKPIFSFKEHSDCMTRNAGACRGMNITLMNLQYGNMDDQPCVHIERPFKCTCYCLNRQEMSVMYVEGGQQRFMGKIIDPYDCCNYTVN